MGLWVGEMITATDQSSRTPESECSSGWSVEVFYDGKCPLCMREIRMLQRFDRRHRIRCTDIAAPDFDPEDYHRSMADFMGEIHGRLPNGNWIYGVEVFRQLYAAVGLGPIVLLTRAPGISHLMNLGYRCFAKNRLRLTGRCTSESCAILPTGHETLG